MDIILHPQRYYRVREYRLVERLLFDGITNLVLLDLRITSDLRITTIISIKEGVTIDLTILVTMGEVGIKMIMSHIIMRTIMRIQEVGMAGVVGAVSMFE